MAPESDHKPLKFGARNFPDNPGAKTVLPT